MGKKTKTRTSRTRPGQLERRIRKGIAFTLFKGKEDHYQVEMHAKGQSAAYLVGKSENYENREIDVEVEKAYERIIDAKDSIAQFWIEKDDLTAEMPTVEPDEDLDSDDTGYNVDSDIFEDDF